MCYIFSCFGWALDFLQRALTFVLACILSCIVTIGVLVAIAAGVAYGYNYSMAEFLTFTREDTAVYMRRGQFYDKPDFDSDTDIVNSRRSGGGDSEDQNNLIDFQNLGPGMEKVMGRGLPNSWGQNQDTRKYAELLTKYSRKPQIDPVVYGEDEELTKTPAAAGFPPVEVAVKRVSMAPNPRVIPTTVIAEGSSRIVMRKYKPIGKQGPDLDVNNLNEASGAKLDRYSANNLYPDVDLDARTKFYELNQYRPTIASLSSSTSDLKTDKQPTFGFSAPMRHWGPAKQNTRGDAYFDYKEDIDEDNVVYKPV